MDAHTLDETISFFIKNNFSGKLSLGGGESLLFSNFNYFIASILEKTEASLRILSNGKNFTANLPNIYFDDRIKWGITFDGFINKHIEQIQKSVDLDLIKKNLEQICALRNPKCFYINYLLTSENIDGLMSLLEFCVKNNIREIYVTSLLVFKDVNEQILSAFIPDLDSAIVIEKIEEAKDYSLKHDLIVQFPNNKGINVAKVCDKKDPISPIIDIDGSVSFCSGREEITLGNIWDENLLEKWNIFFRKIHQDRLFKEKWCAKCFGKITDINGYHVLPSNKYTVMSHNSNHQ
jgi:MoaA/NifB/PqqE/SkfB family radical SAM enzyme